MSFEDESLTIREFPPWTWTRSLIKVTLTLKLELAPLALIEIGTVERLADIVTDLLEGIAIPLKALFKISLFLLR